MPHRSERVTIGEHEYEIRTLQLRQARKLSKMVGKAVAPLVNAEEVGSNLAAALTELSDAEMEQVTKLCAEASDVSLDGKFVPLSTADLPDTHFAGDVWSWAMWVWNVLKMNGGPRFLALANDWEARAREKFAQ